MKFGLAREGVLFTEIHEALPSENLLGSTLHRMRKKGFIASSGGLIHTRYRITVAGRKAIS